MNQEMVKTFNENLRKIKRELTRQEVVALYNEFKPEDDGHLAKILTLRGVSL